MQLTADRITANEKSEALARMAMGIVHDFRNILTVVQNCSEVIAHSDQSTLIQENCDLIQEVTRRGTQFIRELADFGKSTPTQPTVLNINNEIQAFMPILQTEIRGRSGGTHHFFGWVVDLCFWFCFNIGCWLFDL